MAKRFIIERLIGLSAVGAFGAGLAAPAAAGPWTMAQGDFRLINTTIYSSADRSFDSEGHVYDAPDYDQFLTFFNSEYGLTDDITLIAAPSLRLISTESSGKSFGLGTTEIGGRLRLIHDDHFILSAQTTVFLPGTARGSQVAQLGTRDTQADARIQMGYGFGGSKISGFASVEGGYRLRSGDPPNEFHADATIGIHGSDRLLLIANLFNTWSDGRGSGAFPRYQYSNLYAGGVYDLGRHLSVQIGGLATVTGRNALRERGLYSGIWLKF